MNVSAIENQVAKLHQTAVKFAVRNVNGHRYSFTFNGRNYSVRRADGQPIANGTEEMEFNTRKIGVAKEWLREWLSR